RFGVSGAKWKFAARAAVSTLIASIGGGGSSGGYGRLRTLPYCGRICGWSYWGSCGDRYQSIPDSLRVDDPVGATAIHAFGGLWGLVAVALFAEEDEGLGFTKGHPGLNILKFE
ncbi:unnamed protein product, partial [Allacma fusca]